MQGVKSELTKHKELRNIKVYCSSIPEGVVLWVTPLIDQAIRYAQKGVFSWPMLRMMLTKLSLKLEEMYRSIPIELLRICTPDHIRIGRSILAWATTASAERPLPVKEIFDSVAITNA
ncbi:hypothetical protein F5X97DRAFT_260219 [Nemania serpens]|nr:hypothetical protein F5X97DRAFT_260219 [Nemania serpens]